MSNTTTLTITRALTLIKSLDNEIKTYFDQERILISALIGTKEKTVLRMIQNKEELTAKIQSDYDGLNALVNKRRAIKNAVVLSNATCLINIDNKVITVAEAIELKNQLPIKESILKAYRNQYSQVQKFLDKNANELETRILELVKYQTNEDTTAEDKLKMLTIVRENEEKNSLAKLYDPINLVEKITQLENEIRTIKNELDYVLSEHNATTTISVNY